jgi:hypothetical protein
VRLPEWAAAGGAVVGLQGGSSVVRAKVKKLRAADVPIIAVWLQVAAPENGELYWRRVVCRLCTSGGTLHRPWHAARSRLRCSARWRLCAACVGGSPCTAVTPDLTSLRGQQSAAKGSSTTVSRSDIRLIQHLDSSAHGLVWRWRLIGYFPIHLVPAT